MIRMCAPAGLTSFSHEGHPIEIDGDGFVRVDARHRLDLEAHGFRSPDNPASAGAAVAPALAGDRAELARLFAERVASATDEEVAAMIEQARGAKDADDGGDDLDPATVTAEDIDRMKRGKLFAFLKARGVQVGPPIDNDALRAKARAALAA